MEKYWYAAILCLVTACIQHFLLHDDHIASFLIGMAIGQVVIAVVSTIVEHVLNK